jgi:hypothetical protein
MLVLAVMTLESQPASAEMFGADYKPCGGDKQSTLDIVACVDLSPIFHPVESRIRSSMNLPPCLDHPR